GGGQRAELEREKQDEEQAEPEDGHGDAEDREQREEVVPRGAAADRGGDAGREAEDERPRHAGERELERIAEAVKHLPQHGLSGDEGHTEIGGERALAP